MQQFLSVIKIDPHLQQMTDQQQLKKKISEKVKNRRNEVQLVPKEKDGKVSSRYMANIIQLQNNEMSKQLQNNRDASITRKDDLESSSINRNSALNRFQNKVQEIQLSSQLKEEDQQIMEQESERE